MDPSHESVASSADTARLLLSSDAKLASSRPKPKLLAALRQAATASSEDETDSEDAVSASEDEILAMASTSKLPTASVLQSVTMPSDKEEEESDNGAAYERLKKRLAAGKSSAKVQNIQKELPIGITTESSDDDITMPVQRSIRNSIARIPKPNSATSSPPPSARSRQPSPGLFVTPHASPLIKKHSKHTAGTSSESDTSSRSFDADMQERVKRIRAKRLAKQQEGDSQQSNSRKLIRWQMGHGSGSETDDEIGRRLTQQAKPTRKAGKKAMEAMARDQQRISRNMQLTHQSKTKKRYTTKDLFARMGFHAPNEQAVALPTPDASSVLASSDADANQAHDTPPTSPPTEDDLTEKTASSTATVTPTAKSSVQDQNQISEPMKIDKGKERAPEFEHLPVPSWKSKTESITVQNAHMGIERSSDTMVELSDSEDDLKGMQPKSRFPVFDRLPTKKQQEPASLLHLRSLAQLAKSPPKGKKGQKRVTLAEMEWSLAQKARQQKNKQREERIAELKQRGHIIETEEEREKHQMEIEDMVAQFEKQRQEDLNLAKMERDEAKKNGETIDDLPSSDESDGDYVASGEENADQDEAELEEELQLSGSEEEMEGVEEINEDDESDETARLQQKDEDADTEEEVSTLARKQRVNRGCHRVVDDEDESDKERPGPASATQPATQDDVMAGFGFSNAKAGLGLTQMFAGTMANLESDSQTAPVINPEAEQDSLDFLRNLPETQPAANFSQASDFMAPNSQALSWQREESQTDPETQFSLGISQVIKTSPVLSRTQLEDFELTQDAGFSFSRSPAGVILPPSTIDTVMMSIAESPLKLRKNRLQRGRREATVELSDVEEDILTAQEQASEDDIQRPPNPSDAFMKMQKAAKRQKAVDDFNKKTSLAKEAVMEQAEESEDEYAGLGGASDDEEGEEEQELKDMIDHNDVKVDERQIAAFYADKAKKEDEKNIADLYKKIQTGGLRRQAGGGDGFDMTDSEDEAEHRQRKKQAAFQKMSRALLKDERVKQLADDPKKKPFFNTLADFADEGDYEFLDMPAEMGADEQEESQNDAGAQEEDMIPDSQAADTAVTTVKHNSLKRKHGDSQKENRPPPQLRRTAATDQLTRKPMTLADVQNSVSELLEDIRIIVPDSQYSDSEGEESCAAPNASNRKAIVDRLTLSRTPTIESTPDNNMAFHAPCRTAAAPGFRMPSLIRRATSNMSTNSESRGSSGTNTPTESGVRRGGTGRSNIHAQAREAERRALLDKKDGKRKEALKKKVEGGRRRAGGMRRVMGGFGRGF